MHEAFKQLQRRKYFQSYRYKKKNLFKKVQNWIRLVFWIVLKSWNHSSRSQHAPICRHRGCIVVPLRVDEHTDHQTHEPLPPPLHTSLLRMRSLSEPSELSEKISSKEFCFGSDVIWRVGSGLIWRGVRSQVEKRVFDFLQTFLFCSDVSVPVWSEQVCGNLYSNYDLVSVTNGISSLTRVRLLTPFLQYERSK